jgi:hypothetical protein
MRCRDIWPLPVVLRTVLLVVFLSLVLGVEAFEGRGVGITDGDSITVLHNQRPVKVRLKGIDAPESGQAFRTRAKQATSALAFGHVVTVHPQETRSVWPPRGRGDPPRRPESESGAGPAGVGVVVPALCADRPHPRDARARRAGDEPVGSGQIPRRLRPGCGGAASPRADGERDMLIRRGLRFRVYPSSDQEARLLARGARMPSAFEQMQPLTRKETFE